MRCRTVQRELSIAFDGASHEVSSKASAHAASCRRCQHFIDTATRARAVLRHESEGFAIIEPDVTPISLRSSTPRSARPRSVRLRPAVAAVAVAVSIVAGAVVIARDDSGPGVSTVADEFPVADNGESVLLVWTSGGLPATLAAEVAAIDGVTRTTEVLGDHVALAAPGGTIDLDALAVDPATYAPLVPRADRDAFARLDRDEAILSRTSATLRDVGVDDPIALVDGPTLRVARIVDDELVGAAELIVAVGALDDVRTPRYLLVRYRGDRDRVEDEIRLAVPSELGVRFHAPDEAAILRHGDAVLPQAWIKRDFGEWIDTDPSSTISTDPAFADQIREFTVEGLGTVTCHRELEAPLRKAIASLPPDTAVELDGTETVCFEPRSSQNAGGPSRHSWGIAIDLDIAAHVKAGLGDTPAGLVEAFTGAGFVWGGDWLDPDPVHFEYVGTSAGR